MVLPFKSPIDPVHLWARPPNDQTAQCTTINRDDKCFPNRNNPIFLTKWGRRMHKKKQMIRSNSYIFVEGKLKLLLSNKTNSKE